MSKLSNTVANAEKFSQDMEGQQRWLSAEAKWRGFSSVEELWIADPDEFVSLASLWRCLKEEGLDPWDGIIG